MLLVIKNIILILLVLALAIAVHEFGHWYFYYKKFGFKFNLEWWYKSPLQCGFRSYFPPVPKKDEKNNLLFSIFLGLIIIVFFVTINHFYIYALPLYFAGCKKDIYRLMALIDLEVEEDGKTLQKNK